MRLTAIFVMGGIIFCSLLSGQYTAPEFVQPYYDAYSRNFIDSEAAGRGHTGVAAEGGIEKAVFNPAAFHITGKQLYLEMFWKPPQNEMNQVKLLGDQSYASPMPLGAFGFGMNLGSEWCLGLLMQVPNTLEYDSYSIHTMSADQVSAQPTYMKFNTGLVASVKLQSVSIGLNTILETYYHTDYRKYFLWDRPEFTDHVIRFQPGLRWQSGNLSVGLSYLLSADHEFDMSVLSHAESDSLEVYDTTLPAILQAGLFWDAGQFRLYADIEQEFCSEQDSRYDDRYRIKFGAERDFDKFTFRCGLISTNEVYTGDYIIPLEQSHNPDQQNQPYYPETYVGSIEGHNQLLLTMGFTRSVSWFRWSVHAMTDVAGEYLTTQIGSSISIDLDNIPKVRRK